MRIDWERYLPREQRGEALWLTAGLVGVWVAVAAGVALQSEFVPLGSDIPRWLQVLIPPAFAAAATFAGVLGMRFVRRMPRSLWFAVAAIAAVEAAARIMARLGTLLSEPSTFSLRRLASVAGSIALPVAIIVGSTLAVLVFQGIRLGIERRREEASRDPEAEPPSIEYVDEYDLFDRRTHEAFSWPSLLPSRSRPFVYGLLIVVALRAVADLPLMAILFWFQSRLPQPVDFWTASLVVLLAIWLAMTALALVIALFLGIRVFRAPRGVWVPFLLAPPFVEVGSLVYFVGLVRRTGWQWAGLSVIQMVLALVVSALAVAIALRLAVPPTAVPPEDARPA